MSLNEKLLRWDREETSGTPRDSLFTLITFLMDKLYNTYEPSMLTPFRVKLDRWLSNLTDEDDQKTMLHLLGSIYYAGPKEFESLYRMAKVVIENWCQTEASLALDHPNLENETEFEMRRTWLVPLTDSLRINSLLKVCSLEGHDERPTWRPLHRFASIDKINAYMQSEGIVRIVLLEDFVGTGSQVESTIQWTLKSFPGVRILFCPLVICPVGDKLFRTLEAKEPDFIYIPVSVLPQSSFVNPTPLIDEPTYHATMRTLVTKYAHRLRKGVEPFGYRDTGALFVMFSNCPDNTLSLIHDESVGWEPLFPRVWRPE